MNDDSLIRNAGGDGIRLDVTPESTGWRFLSFRVVHLAAGTSYDDHRPGQETAIVPLSGSATVTAVSSAPNTLARAMAWATALSAIAEASVATMMDLYMAAFSSGSWRPAGLGADASQN